jgi:hypothetical protein
MRYGLATTFLWQEGQGMPQLSMLGEALLKDTVLLGAALLTAAESLRATVTDVMRVVGGELHGPVQVVAVQEDQGPRRAEVNRNRGVMQTLA